MIAMNQPFCEGISRALRFRAHMGIGPTNAICAVDVAMNDDVEVWMQDVLSVDGVYAGGGSPKIILSSKRPLSLRTLSDLYLLM